MVQIGICIVTIHESKFRAYGGTTVARAAGILRKLFNSYQND